MKTNTYSTALLRLAAVCAFALVFTLIVVLAAGAPPVKTLTLLFQGGLGTMSKVGHTMVVWVPLCLCSTALLVTFASGLWNIGVEGQVIMGAVFSTWWLRFFEQGGDWWVVALAPGGRHPGRSLVGHGGRGFEGLGKGA